MKTIGKMTLLILLVASTGCIAPHILTSGTLGTGKFNCAIAHGGTNTTPIIRTWWCGMIQAETVPRASTTHWTTTIFPIDGAGIDVKGTNGLDIEVLVHLLEETNLVVRVRDRSSMEIDYSVYSVGRDTNGTLKLIEQKN